jgi:hypothetical protein
VCTRISRGASKGQQRISGTHLKLGQSTRGRFEVERLRHHGQQKIAGLLPLRDLGLSGTMQLLFGLMAD